MPLVGATVITKKVWDALPDSAKPALLKAAEEAGEVIKKHGRQENEEAIAAMQKRGLHVQEPDAQTLTAWRQFMDPVYPRIRGKMVPADLYDEVTRLLEEFRGARTSAAP